MTVGTDTGTLFRAVEVAAVDITAWEAAFEAWLASKAPNTRRAYRQAWDDFMATAGDAPWAMGSAEVEAWVGAMRARGLAKSTISQRVAAVSSFFRFACERYSVRPGETLHNFNPALTVDRPRMGDYNEAVFLTVDQARAFWGAVREDEGLQGLRNQALFGFYLLTGRRNGEIRRLRRRDLRRVSESIWQYRWRGKGTERWDMAPPPALAALVAYLEAAGRWVGMGPEEWLFTATLGNAGRLPNVPQGWAPHQSPLSASEVRRLVKMYARRAGIRVEGLTVHSLRHTFTTILRENGYDIGEIQRAVGHSSSEVTERYIHALGGGEVAAWETVREALGME